MSDLRERIAHANEQVSVYEFIEYVPDRSRPRKIHCPVHDDRTKSAQVYPDTNSLYCFTCGMSYDPVGLVAESEGLNVLAAVEYIERLAGVRWERQETNEDEFWELVRKAQASPDDPTYWTRRQLILYRWEIHKTVLQMRDAASVDWEGFDSAHLDVRLLRKWQDEQLDNAQDASKVKAGQVKEDV